MSPKSIQLKDVLIIILLIPILPLAGLLLLFGLASGWEGIQFLLVLTFVVIIPSFVLSLHKKIPYAKHLLIGFMFFSVACFIYALTTYLQ